jgi:hypothetical protein
MHQQYPYNKSLPLRILAALFVGVDLIILAMWMVPHA